MRHVLERGGRGEGVNSDVMRHVLERGGRGKQ